MTSTRWLGNPAGTTTPPRGGEIQTVSPPLIVVCSDEPVEVTCTVCGDPSESSDPPMDWSLARRRRGDQMIEEWTCPACSRDNARAIEAKLDREWW